MALSPAAVSAIIGGIPAAYQLGTGISQGIRARRLSKKKRPDYVIPNEITDNVNLTQNAYNASSMYGLPGQGRIQNQLMGSQASANNSIAQSQQSPAAQLLGYASVNQNTNNAIANLGVDAAQFRANNMQQNLGSLLSAKQALAQYRDKEFELNKLKPFNDAMAAVGALRAGSMQNIYGGLSSAANTAGIFVNKGGGIQGSGGGAPTQSANRIATGQTQMGSMSNSTLFEALKNSPEFAGLTDDEIKTQLMSLLQKG